VFANFTTFLDFNSHYKLALNDDAPSVPEEETQQLLEQM